MVNPVRGEVAIEIDGRPHTLCLTLGALAELEALDQTGEQISAGRLVDVLLILLRAGGSPLQREDLLRARIDLADAAEAVGSCFDAAKI